MGNCKIHIEVHAVDNFYIFKHIYPPYEKITIFNSTVEYFDNKYIALKTQSNSSNYSITYLAGGILENGKVSTQILSITPNFPSIIKKVETISETTFFPIPTNNIVEVSYSSFSSSKIKIFLTISSSS